MTIPFHSPSKRVILISVVKCIIVITISKKVVAFKQNPTFTYRDETAVDTTRHILRKELQSSPYANDTLIKNLPSTPRM